jgi:hypothetical protein
MSEEDFYARLGEFLAGQRPDLDGAIDPALQLWTAGYLDSFGLIETIDFLEGLLGRPLVVGTDDLPSFFTMKDMFLAFGAG